MRNVRQLEMPVPARRSSTLRYLAVAMLLALTTAACSSTLRERGSPTAVVSGPGDLVDGDGEPIAPVDLDGDGHISDEEIAAAQDAAEQGRTSTTGRTGGPGRAAGGGGGGGGGAGGGNGPGGGGGGGGGGGAPINAGPGIANGKIKIGFIVLSDFQSFGATFGFNPPKTGNGAAQARALEKLVNANGGIAGYQLEIVLRTYNPQNASQGAEEAMCRGFTEDDKVFAVVMQGQLYDETRACYSSRRTLMLEPTLYSYDDDFYAQHAPYYWSPSYPHYSKVWPAMIPSLERRGFFKDGTLGVILWDTPEFDRILQNDLKPQLDARGIDIAVVHRIDKTDAGTIQSGNTNGVFALRSAGVNRVLFIGGAPLQPFFMITAESANYRPRYGMNSFDSPFFTEDNDGWARHVQGAVGIGFNPASDIADSRYVPLGQHNATEAHCMQVMATEGESFPRRYDARQALSYCESVLLLKRAADAVGPNLTPEAWSQAVSTVGTSFEAANSFQTMLSPASHAGGHAYREITYETSCLCWRYTSDVIPFG